MKAIDTNVIARAILGDDAVQSPIAVSTLREPVWISMTVWLELGWVLGTRLGLDRSIVADAIATVLAMESVNTPDRAGLDWAIDRFRAGADWADMIHLLSARGFAGSFVTFDRAITPRAGDAPPLPIQTLA